MTLCWSNPPCPVGVPRFPIPTSWNTTATPLTSRDGSTSQRHRKKVCVCAIVMIISSSNNNIMIIIIMIITTTTTTTIIIIIIKIQNTKLCFSCSYRKNDKSDYDGQNGHPHQQSSTSTVNIHQTSFSSTEATQTVAALGDQPQQRHGAGPGADCNELEDVRCSMYEI